MMNPRYFEIDELYVTQQILSSHDLSDLDLSLFKNPFVKCNFRDPIGIELVYKYKGLPLGAVFIKKTADDEFRKLNIYSGGLHTGRVSEGIDKFREAFQVLGFAMSNSDPNWKTTYTKVCGNVFDYFAEKALSASRFA